MSSAQTISPQSSSKQIQPIDSFITQEANKHTRNIEVCPKANDTTIAHCLSYVIIDTEQHLS